MKFYTSYYGNYKSIPTDYYCVGISRYCPDGFKDNPDYKLSDIHSVVESDWIFIGY